MHPSPPRRPRSLWHLSHSLVRPCPTLILGLHLARTASVTVQHLPVLGQATTLVIHSPSYALLGDNRGWIYTLSDDDQCTVDSNLGTDSEISSLNISPDSFSLATSFGPASRIRVQNLADPNLSWLITPRGLHDIRCSDYSVDPNQAVVGAKQYAVYLTDILNQPKTTLLHTHSDVFALTRQHDLVYAGTRNGSIHRFDLRIPPPPKNSKNTSIFSAPRPRSSTVLHMQSIGDVYFLSSYINGEIVMYDIRFTQRHSPVLRFPGHVNTYTPRLGIVTDSSSTFLFAAGQDRKLRAWSIPTGEPLLPSPSNPHPNPFSIQFPQPIQTLQMTSSNHDMGGQMGLWAGCGDKLYKFDLGCVRN